MPSSVRTVTASLKPNVTVTASSGDQTPSPSGSGSTATDVTTGASAKPSSASTPAALRIVAPLSESPPATTRAPRAPSSAAPTSWRNTSSVVPEPPAYTAARPASPSTIASEGVPPEGSTVTASLNHTTASTSSPALQAPPAPEAIRAPVTTGSDAPPRADSGAATSPHTGSDHGPDGLDRLDGTPRSDACTRKYIAPLALKKYTVSAVAWNPRPVQLPGAGSEQLSTSSQWIPQPRTCASATSVGGSQVNRSLRIGFSNSACSSGDHAGSRIASTRGFSTAPRTVSSSSSCTRYIASRAVPRR